MDSQKNIAELIEQCRTGDDVAHAQFYTRFYPFIIHAVARQLRKLNVYHTKSDIEDLTSEIIITISANRFRKMSSIRQPKSIRGWLYVVTQNHVISHIRREARRDQALIRYANESQEPYHGAEPEFVIKNTEEKQILHDALQTLDEDDRLIVSLYYIDKLKYYEIADVLSLNIKTVATRLRRAKIKLRTKLMANDNDH